MVKTTRTAAIQRLSTLFTPQRIALLIAIIILSISIPLLIGGKTTLYHLASLSWPYLTALLLLLATKWGLNALRWQIFLRTNSMQLRSTDILAIMWLYDSAAESTPGGVGGPIAGWALLRSHQVPTIAIASMGLFMLALDIIAIMSLGIWALLSATALHQQGIHWQVMIALPAMLLALVMLWSMLHYRRGLIRGLARLRASPGISRHLKRPVRLWLRLGQTIERMAQTPRLLLLVMVLASIGHWCCRLSILYVAILAVGQHVAWVDAFSIQLITGLTGMVVGLPGGFLGADITMTALLAPMMDIKTIVSVILLWRLLTFHATLLMGVLSFAWLGSLIYPPGTSRAPELK